MAKITVQLAPLRNPQWSAAPLKPGAEVTLSVEAPKIKAGQHIEFRILYGTDLVDVVNGQDAQQTAKWSVPNLPHSPRLKFDALLQEKPSPKAGIHGVLGKVSSPLADVKGFAVTITNIDANFVPHAEQIHVAYTVSDPAGAATSARVEVWGERYSTNQPLYRTDPFAPAHGAHNWNTWDGKANLGPLAGKYITPEYSPYRLRIIAGVDQASVDDPFAAGLKKVAVAEKPFEVEFQSAWIRVQAGIVESAAAGSNYSLARALAVEPYNPNGTFAAMGRLPLEQETGPNRPGVGRIRIPMACHHRSPTDSLAQPGLAIGSGYGTVKQAVDALFYSRPEIPLEFEMRLKSRVDATNKTPTFGLFDKEAVGPVKIEPFAEDVFVTALYNGAGVNQTYWRKAACKVKHGTHTGPVNDGVSAPLFHHWQARFTVAADGAQNFDLDTFDAADQTYRYVVGSGELKVYLNRTMLTLGANEAAINKGDADYIEVDVHTIKLRPNLTKANNVLWVVRSAAAGAVANWNAYPPGVNCHAQYGGVRGAAPNNLFLKNYSPAPGGVKEPVIGNVGGAYAYNAHNFINLSPDPVPAANQERVEVSAILTGAQQGLAGIIFTPSFMAGDTYGLHARLNRTPYERNLGWEDDQPFIDGKSGQLSIWRVITISNSQRLPTAGTAGLAPGIGSTAEAAVGGRAHIGDGVSMSVSGMNVTLSNAFNEWTTAPPNPAIAPAADVHKDVNLGTYIATNNGLAMGAGRVNMPNNGAVLNVFVAFDHYRVFVPADIPANRVNATANAIAALPAGGTSARARAALNARFAPLGAADEPAGAPAIPPHANFGKAYSDWVLGQIRVHRQTLINALTPSLAPQPKTMQVIRWPNLHDSPIWNQFAGMGSAGMTITGFEVGNGQSFFRTSNPGADGALFPHEMGHGSHLIHFVAGAAGFGWKHHNVLQPGCMMSYNFPTGFIVPGAAATVGPVGGAAAPDTGWPNVVPAALPANSSIVAGTAPGTQCIQLGPPAPTTPCAKCMLKLRGWREDLLPVAWRHPDLF